MRPFLYLMLMLPGVFAGTKLRYFRNTSCNDNQLGDFGNDNSRADTDCHIPPRNITKAIFVDDIDTDCAIITYSDYACTAERARRSFADKEMCFFSRKGGLLRSWRTVCGKEMISIAAAWETYQKTHISSATAAPSVTVMSGTSYELTTYTTLSSWTSWNATGPATLYATVTKTGTTPLPSPTTGAAVAVAEPDVILRRWALMAVAVAAGGFAAAI